MTVIIIIVSLVLSAFNYEPWWLDTNPQYQKDNYSAHVDLYTTQNRLLDSIYNAEGKENARIPFGMFTQEFERRSATGEIIPYEEAKAETSRHINRHIKRWEAGGTRNILNANARGLINANPEKNEAIIDGEWNPDFLKWYGEIYAPSHLSNTTLRPAEKEKNHNWLGNVRAGLNAV